MAKWNAIFTNWTPVLVADTTAFTNSGYAAIQGGSTTQLLKIWEVKLGGLAAASSPCQLMLAHDSTVGATSLSGGLNTALKAATAALAAPPNIFSTSTTKPQRSSTLYLYPFGFNANGGIVRWVAFDESECPEVLGNTASLGEISLSSLNAGTAGLIDSTLVYEPL